MTRANPSFTLAERLRHRGWTVTDSGCWEWSGGRSLKGYGGVWNGFKVESTHRVAYRVWVGEIPEGYVVRHKCDNPPCINPDHLEVGTHADNSRDMVDRKRNMSGANHHNAKLFEQDVLDIRREYAKGVLTQRMLGDVYGVSPSTVGEIIRKEIWSV